MGKAHSSRYRLFIYVESSKYSYFSSKESAVPNKEFTCPVLRSILKPFLHQIQLRPCYHPTQVQQYQCVQKASSCSQSSARKAAQVATGFSLKIVQTVTVPAETLTARRSPPQVGKLSVRVHKVQQEKNHLSCPQTATAGVDIIVFWLATSGKKCSRRSLSRVRLAGVLTTQDAVCTL